MVRNRMGKSLWGVSAGNWSFFCLQDILMWEFNFFFPGLVDPADYHSECNRNCKYGIWLRFDDCFKSDVDAFNLPDSGDYKQPSLSGSCCYRLFLIVDRIEIICRVFFFQERADCKTFTEQKPEYFSI